jgi:hypothetical protein
MKVATIGGVPYGGRPRGPPFLGESLMLLEVCIKNLEGFIVEELINSHGVN